MTFAAMRLDIQPLCNKHFRTMKLVNLIWFVPGMPDVNSTPAFACDVEVCGRYYDALNGYHTRPQGRIQQTESQVLCSKDSLPMFIEHHEPQGSIRRYQCSQVGCIGSKEVRGQP